MANQFITGQGQGDDPNADPLKKTLASGVNAGQAQPNMDPGKVGNPYASSGAGNAQSLSQGNPYAAPNPYGAPPAAPQAQSQKHAAAAPQPADQSQQPSYAVDPQVLMANYVGGQVGRPTGSGSSASGPTPPPLPELTTGPTGLLSPAQQKFDQGVAAQGDQLRQAADTGETAQQRAARLIEQDNAFQNAPAGGYGGGSSLASTMVAQSAASAGEVERGQNQIKNREAYEQWQQSEKDRQQQEYARRQQESDRALEAYKAQLDSYNISEHDKQAAIQAEKDRQARKNLAGLNLLSGVLNAAVPGVGTLVGRALGGTPQGPAK